MVLGLGERAGLTYCKFLREKKNPKHRENAIDEEDRILLLNEKAELGFYVDHS